MTREIMRQLEQLIRPIKVRLANSIARAVVQVVDDSTKMQLLQLGVLADENVEDAEHFGSYGFNSVPKVGAEAVVLFPNGDRAHGLVVAVGDRRFRPTDWAPGEVGMYTDDTHTHLYFAGPGVPPTVPSPTAVPVPLIVTATASAKVKSD